MRKTLRWKKTIGILAIILGALRFISGIVAYQQLFTTENSLTKLEDLPTTTQETIRVIKNYISFAKIILPINTALLLAMFILGIVLLCVERNIKDYTPSPKSIKLGIAILIITICHFTVELISFLSMPVSITKTISIVTIFVSLGFVSVLIGFCSNGLFGRPKNWRDLVAQLDIDTPTKPIEPQNEIIQTSNQLDLEINELKKQIEKRKLEKEMTELNAQKQAEIEKLKKELTELE